MRSVDIDGVSLELQHIAPPAGAAPARAPLVFLHEGLGSVALWRDWPARLCAATGRAGWVYSRRGYGRSSPVPDVRGAGRLPPDHLHREALDVLPALLRALGLARPVLVGHSDGASIALIHAAHHPVTACVAMAPHVMVEALCLRAIEQTRQHFETGALRIRLQRFHDDVDGAFWQWNDAWLNPQFHGFDIRADIRSIDAPLLAIQGVDDGYASMAQLDDIATALPHTRLLKLPACGHAPHQDQPAAVQQAITDLLADLP